MTHETTKISIGILVFKGDLFLFGKTNNKVGEIECILPIGHLEFMESFTACTKREILEVG